MPLLVIVVKTKPQESLSLQQSKPFFFLFGFFLNCHKGHCGHTYILAINEYRFVHNNPGDRFIAARLSQ